MPRGLGRPVAAENDQGWRARAGPLLHVVAADDQEHDETIVITAYEPDPNEWEADFKTRKRH